MKRMLIFLGGAVVGAVAMAAWLDDELTRRDLRISKHEKEHNMMRQRIDQLISEPTREELDTAIAGLTAIIKK